MFELGCNNGESERKKRCSNYGFRKLAINQQPTTTMTTTTTAKEENLFLKRNFVEQIELVWQELVCSVPLCGLLGRLGLALWLHVCGFQLSLFIKVKLYDIGLERKRNTYLGQSEQSFPTQSIRHIITVLVGVRGLVSVSLTSLICQARFVILWKIVTNLKHVFDSHGTK